ncbi:MAG: Hsp20/alpha crystallin family protein [Woeseiaceae bacterium]|nr:Hsp20/alpha crystallin family protein [Woeseiaceae bacterium]
MNIARFEPWSLIDMLHRDLDQIAGRRFGMTNEENGGATVADWVPAVDIVEEKDRFVLRADVPGVNPDDIDVNMENGMLTVSGERHDEKTEETQGMRRVERVSGKFYRRFSLPDTANADEISARSTNGILEVVIPKQPAVQARRITVKSA